MEQLGPPAFNPHLKRVLDTYQNASVRSLSGPSNYVAGWGDPSKMSPAELEEFRIKAISSLTGKKPQSGMIAAAAVSVKTHEFAPSPFPIQQVPVLMAMDSSRSEKSETMLEGETISCFIVGGEKRLCLPQILNTVLRDFSLHQINAVCDDLHIFCSRCNPEQLENLKMTAVLPLSAPSCGLITKTDAERLCNALLHSAPQKSAEPPTPNSFRVYHECFGKCKGIFSPELYTSPHARCIECSECSGMFCPQKFVCHSHNTQENRTCHWGFDSANWRSYLLLSKDQECKSKYQELLDRMKARFDLLRKYKRKSASPDASGIKRARYEENKRDPSFDSTTWTDGAYRHISAFQPWAPSLLAALKEGKTLQLSQQHGDVLATSLPAYLQTGPPVLLNPESVIPHSESSRYERHFAPNVSLAPQSQQMIRVKEEMVDDGEKLEHPLNNSELNVSSDTDDNSVPTTPQERRNTSDSFSSSESMNMPDHSQELMFLKRALNGEVENKESAQDYFTKEFLQIRKQDEDRYRSLLMEKRHLQEEVERLQVVKKQQADLKSENEYLKKEIDMIRCDHERRMVRMTETVESLKKENNNSLHNHKSPDVLKNKAKYKAQVAELKARLRQSEQFAAQMRQEMELLQSEWKKLGKELPVRPPDSPVKSPVQHTDSYSSHNGGDVNGENGSMVVSVKEEPKSDSEQSAGMP